MAEIGWIDSRRGNDSYPGRVRNDVLVTDPSFSDGASGATNFMNAVTTFNGGVGASMTTSTNLQHTGANFNAADHLGHYVRLQISSTWYTKKITAIVDGNNVTIQTATTGSVDIYYIGGAKKSIDTLNPANPSYIGNNVQGGVSDSSSGVYIDGVHTPSTLILTYGNPGAKRFRTYRGNYIIAPVGSKGAISVTNNTQVYDFEGESKVDASFFWPGQGSAITDVCFYNCHDHGNGILFGGGYHELNAAKMFNCSAKNLMAWVGTYINYGASDIQEMRNCTEYDRKSNYTPMSVKGPVVDNIFRTTAVRTYCFLAGPFAYTVDYNTYFAPAGTALVASGIFSAGAQTGTTYTTDTFYTATTGYKAASGRSQEWWVDGVNRETTTFHDEANGIFTFDKSSIEATSSSTGSYRGAFRPAKNVSAPFVLNTPGDAKSWSASASDFEIISGHLHFKLVSGSSTACFPDRNHVASIAGPPAVAYRASGTIKTAWDLDADYKVGNLIAALRNQTATAFWDNAPTTGGRTFRLIMWTSAAWDAGLDAGSGVYDSASKSLAPLDTSTVIARYVSIELTGYSE